MEPLNRQRCFHHSERQAVARCPECGRYFCRECIAEHDDRVLCAGCLKKLARQTSGPKLNPLVLRAVTECLQTFCGVFILWLFFYFCGRALLSIPSKFHDGSVWKSNFSESGED